MAERIEVFTDSSRGDLEIDVNSWLEQNPDIEIAYRQFATCTVSAGSEHFAQFSYCIAYREKLPTANVRDTNAVLAALDDEQAAIERRRDAYCR